MVDIERAICGYLQTHRRINIPALGAILRRGVSNTMIFSEFAKGDDGVLREELVRLGETEISAGVQIECFVERVMQAMDEGHEFEIDGIGRLKRDESGVIVLRQSTADVVATQQFVEPIEVVKPQVSAPQESAPQEAATCVEEEEAFVEGEEYDEVVYEDENGVITPAKAKRRLDPFTIFLIVAVAVALSLFAGGFVMAWSVGSVTLPEPIDRVMLKVFGDGMDAVEEIDVEEIDIE